MNIKISILVPVYNVEQYLQRCIESVLTQDFQDWEMILVDDGSPDRCPEICDEYAKQDYRIKVIHKKNGGLVSARLAGFEASVGKYLMFLDSDDYLLPNALSVLYDKIEEGYDIVKGNDVRINDKGINKIESPKLLEKEVVGANQYLKSILAYDLLPYLWGGLYKRNLFNKKIFEQSLDITICEDWITNIAISKNVNRYFSLNETVYAYYINDQSMMQQSVISFEYQDKLKMRLLNIGFVDATANDYIECAFIIANLKGLFVPELSWSDAVYSNIVKYINDSKNYLCIKKGIDNKFLHFIHNKYLFHFYTNVYKILFKKIRMKGMCRKVVK